MPFTASCPYCPAKTINIPDRALGASIRCSQCGNNYTAVPSETPVKAHYRSGAAAIPKAVPSAEIAEEKPESFSRETDPSFPSESLLSTFSQLSSSKQFPAWVNSWGVAGFFLSGVALLSASLNLWWFLPLSLSGFGLLVCLPGFLFLGDDRRTKDLVWLILGGTANTLVLLVFLFRPGWLNERWELDSAVAEIDLNQMVLVPLDEKNDKADWEKISQTDWVNAQKHGIRQGDVLIQVASATVEKNSPGGPRLLIALHLSNVGWLRKIIYQGAASGNLAAVLRDGHGRALSSRNLGKESGQVERVSLLANREVNDLLVFEAPSPDAAFLELELPAAGWEREGICKFKIPAAMIHREKPPRGGLP